MKTASKQLLSQSQRAEVAKQAAAKAWRTMQSKAYQRAAAKSPKAVQTFLASRKSA